MAESIGQTAVGTYRNPKPSSGPGFAKAWAPLTDDLQKVETGDHYYYDINKSAWFKGVKKGDKYEYTQMDPTNENFSLELAGSVQTGFNPVTGTFDTWDNAKTAGYNPEDFKQYVPGAFGVQQWRSSIVNEGPIYTDFNAQTAAQVQRNARDFSKNAKKYANKLVSAAYDRRALGDLGMNYKERREYKKNLKATYTGKNEGSYVSLARNYAKDYANNYNLGYTGWMGEQAEATAASEAANNYATQLASQAASATGTGTSTTSASNTSSNPATTAWNTEVAKLSMFGPAPKFAAYKRFGGTLNYARLFLW